MRAIPIVLVIGTLATAACSRVSADVDPKAIEAKYGVTGGYLEDIMTEDGKVQATVIPTTLDDGRQVQLIIPHQRVDDRHQVFIRDGVTITPLELDNPNMTRERFVESRPHVTEHHPVTETHRHNRSLEKEVLIVGGSSGAGAAIGALAGGGKGAGIGALSGGAAGLVYDLATRNK